MTDDEFQEKVAELRKELKELIMKKIGGEENLVAEDNDKFIDSYSVALYANLSVLATLAGAFMTRLVIAEQVEPQKAVEVTNHIYHDFFHEVIDKGAESMVDGLNYLKKIKTMN